jgi:hypothetical protein
MSHARRKVIEAESTAPEIAREVVAVLRGLFAVEQQAKELSVAEPYKRGCQEKHLSFGSVPEVFWSRHPAP